MTTPVLPVHWTGAVRIIRSLFPPIDLFEDIADPADWPLILSAETKTNPRLAATIGNLDQVPPGRRVSGPGASWLMAPFTHASPDRPSRFSDGSFGVLYVGESFEVTLFETIHHHQLFMAATAEAPGWTSQFREILMEITGDLHDLRGHPDALHDRNYRPSQALGSFLRNSGSEGVLYTSLRWPTGLAAGLFYPDLAHNPVQGRHLDYHWNGVRVDYIRDATSRQVYEVRPA